MPAHEFVCEDCKADVFSWGGPPDETRCVGCSIIHGMKLTPTEETELRGLFGCELPEADDALRATDQSPG
jgi:hypothetical protein